ncbi:MAG: hypothetical protein RLZZ609_1215 [Cyanobacteriota bacterium]|jgi:hypothetical protein
MNSGRGISEALLYGESLGRPSWNVQYNADLALNDYGGICSFCIFCWFSLVSGVANLCQSGMDKSLIQGLVRSLDVEGFQARR